MDDRGKAAKAILSKVQSRSKATAKLVKNFTDMSLALIRFAYYVANQKAGRSSIPIDPQQEIVRLKNVQDVPVLTIPLEVRADRDYSAAVVGLAGYDHSFESVGGITAPKKIRCRGTDGKMRTQLIKGTFKWNCNTCEPSNEACDRLPSCNEHTVCIVHSGRYITFLCFVSGSSKTSCALWRLCHNIPYRYKRTVLYTIMSVPRYFCLYLFTR